MKTIKGSYHLTNRIARLDSSSSLRPWSKSTRTRVNIEVVSIPACNNCQTCWFPFFLLIMQFRRRQRRRRCRRRRWCPGQGFPSAFSFVSMFGLRWYRSQTRKNEVSWYLGFGTNWNEKSYYLPNREGETGKRKKRKPDKKWAETSYVYLE